MSIVTVVNAVGHPVYCGHESNKKMQGLAILPEYTVIRLALPEEHLSEPYKWNGDNWVADPVAREDLRLAKGRLIPRPQFVSRFKGEELQLIDAAALGDPYSAPMIRPDEDVMRVKRALDALSVVDLMDPELAAKLDVFVAKGLLTHERRSAILSV